MRISKNFLSIGFMGLLLTLTSFNSLAERTPNEEKQVVGYGKDEGLEIYNTWEIYGDTVRYLVNEGDKELTINAQTDDGEVITFTVNYLEYIQEAISEWEATGIHFRLVSSVEGSSVPIVFGVSNNNDGVLGSTIFNPRGGSQTKIFVDKGTLNKTLLNNYSKLKDNGAIPQDMTPEDYIKLKLRITLKHELGHALGLLHNTELDRELTFGRGVSVASCRILNQPPSIMLDGSRYDYISRLSAYLGRPVQPSDIGPSRNDISGARTMYSRWDLNSFMARFSCLSIALATFGSRSDL